MGFAGLLQMLGQVSILKRTENCLDAGQVLSVVERYTSALDLSFLFIRRNDFKEFRRPYGGLVEGEDWDGSFIFAGTSDQTIGQPSATVLVK